MPPLSAGSMPIQIDASRQGCRRHQSGPAISLIGGSGRFAASPWLPLSTFGVGRGRAGAGGHVPWRRRRKCAVVSADVQLVTWSQDGRPRTGSHSSTQWPRTYLRLISSTSFPAILASGWKSFQRFKSPATTKYPVIGSPPVSSGGDQVTLIGLGPAGRGLDVVNSTCPAVLLWWIGN